MKTKCSGKSLHLRSAVTGDSAKGRAGMEAPGIHSMNETICEYGKTVSATGTSRSAASPRRSVSSTRPATAHLNPEGVCVSTPQCRNEETGGRVQQTQMQTAHTRFSAKLLLETSYSRCVSVMERSLCCSLCTFNFCMLSFDFP
jgi:hypothetical protein